MVATMGIIYYFCTVKNQERHEVAARMQRFFVPKLISKKISASSAVAVMPARFSLLIT